MKQQLHREIFISSGGLEPTLWSYNLQVQVWCGYQQRCLDTGKLGDVQRFQTQMNARTSVVPCWQLGCCLVFRSSTWGRHVQLHNAVTNEQEDDLEHVGLTCSSHSQRQPAHRNGAGVQAWGTSSASSPWIHLTCYSNEVRGRCSLMYLLWTWFSCASGELDALPISAWCWHEVCQWQGTATFPVHQPSVALFLWLVRQSFPDRGGPTDHPLSWKSLRICKREVIES